MRDENIPSFSFGEGDFRISRPGGRPDQQIFNSKVYLKDGALTVYRLDSNLVPAMPCMVFAPGYWSEVDKVKDKQAQREPEQVETVIAAELFQTIAKALPGHGGHEKGFRDALESMTLALAEEVLPLTLQKAVTTALDAYVNHDAHHDGDERTTIPRERG